MWQMDLDLGNEMDRWIDGLMDEMGVGLVSMCAV